MFQESLPDSFGTEDHYFIANILPDGEVVIRLNRNEADIDHMMRLE